MTLQRITWTGLFLTFLATLLSISCSPVRFEASKDEGVNTRATHQWAILSQWSTCSKPCGGGFSVREVACQKQNGIAVDDKHCLQQQRPDATRQCNMQACTDSFEWNVSHWGECSKSCGGGTQLRSVVCQNQDGDDVSDGHCGGSKPQTSRACNSDPCSSPISYNWVTSPWSPCSRDCGGGQRTRNVICQGTDGSQAAESNCSGSKPSSSEPCNSQECVDNYTYSWQVGPWTPCTHQCGGGVRARSVYCLRNDGFYSAQDNCSSTAKPIWYSSCNMDSCQLATTPKQQTFSPSPGHNQVDILVIIDDSYSMLSDNQKLAARLNPFVTNLGSTGIDWQMCVTTTRVTYYQGGSIFWVGNNVNPPWIMNSQTQNRSTVFAQTINAIGADWVDSGDEQGIKAMNLHLNNRNSNNCYRQNAALSVIIISDEDERSVGGNPTLDPTQYQPLGPLNLPDTYIANVRDAFGVNKRFTVNSIIVKPGDYECKALQDAQGSLSFYGLHYAELSYKTGGHVGSICDSDYSANLNYFADKIYQSLEKVTLECEPVGSIQVTPNYPFTVSGRHVQFSPVLPPGQSVTIQYHCPN